VQMSSFMDRVGERDYNFDIYAALGGPRLLVFSVKRNSGDDHGLIEHFDVLIPMDPTNRMDNVLDAIKLYAECPTEDTGWLMVVRRLRQKTAAIKDVLLGRPLDDIPNRSDDGIDGVVQFWARGFGIGQLVSRWSQVLQLALREEYKEPGQ